MLDMMLDYRGPIARELYVALRQKILRGSLVPGVAIAEAPVAEELGISRTPVREVFRRLADEGLLDIRPQIGSFVTPIRLSAVYDSQFVRETLECRTVRMAAGNCTPADALALRSHIETQHPAVATGDYLAFFPADEAMHIELIRMAGRPAIWNVIHNVKMQLDRVRYLSFESGNWLDMVFAEHELIVESVIAGDADAAESRMRVHLRSVFAAIERLALTKPHFFSHAG